MENKNKDKIIVGLIIAVVILFANSFVKDKDYFDNKISLLSTSDELDEFSNDDESPVEEKVQEIKVHISGEINNEGVYTINEGDRLDDLVKMAGGLTPMANKDSLNLAMKLADEMKIYIPNINEVTDNDPNSNLALVSSPNLSTDEGKININTASIEELMSLPNIGEKRAQAIIDYRTTNKFEKIEDIKNVTGIGEKFYQALKDLISV